MLYARMAGVGSDLPSVIVSNEDIASLVNKPDSKCDRLERRLKLIILNFDEEQAKMPFTQWVPRVTGVEKRHYAVGITTEEMMANASKNALDMARMKADDLDFIIACSFTPENEIPNAAVTIAHLIGNDYLPGFVQNTACTGFIYGLSVARAYIMSGEYKNILVTAGETLSKRGNPRDPKTMALWGDGAGAAIVKADKEEGICKTYLSSKFSDHIQFLSTGASLDEALLTNEERDYLEARYIGMPGGPNILRPAEVGMFESGLKAIENSPYELDEITWINPHQANLRIIKGTIMKYHDICKDVDLSEFGRGDGRIKTCITIRNEGNISGASTPRTFDKYVREGKIKPGQIVLMPTFGGGYVMGSVVLLWNP